jgi:hypothetical protein
MVLMFFGRPLGWGNMGLATKASVWHLGVFFILDCCLWFICVAFCVAFLEIFTFILRYDFIYCFLLRSLLLLFFVSTNLDFDVDGMR